jgi:hypothetical protein
MLDLELLIPLFDDRIPSAPSYLDPRDVAQLESCTDEKAVRARFAARFDPTCATQWHASLPIAVDFAAQSPVLSLRFVQCELNEVDQVVICFSRFLLHAIVSPIDE